MDKQVKEKWLAALRSGEYEQLREGFHNDGKHCCLAVLGSVLTGDHKYPKYPDDELSHRELADFINRNDGLAGYRAHSFAEIADHIEANIPGE